MALKIFLRQQKIYDINNYTQELHYEWDATLQMLKPVNGALPAGSSRLWPGSGGFVDLTDYVSDLYKLKLEWTANRDDSGNVATDELKPVKSASGTLSFERLAYQLLKAWLVDDVSATLNAAEVKILDTNCGQYTGYIIKSSDLAWCEDNICTLDVTLKQQDEQLSCIKRTFVADNWQGWFQKVPAGGKKHPRFSYCNEVRPNGTLIIEWYLLSSIVANGLMFTLPLAFIINGILFALNGIINTSYQPHHQYHQ